MWGPDPFVGNLGGLWSAGCSGKRVVQEMRRMRHDEFAGLAVRYLERIAAPLDEEDRLEGRGITAVRANELRVAARVVRDLSEAVSREEERGSEAGRLPVEVSS